MSLDWKKLNAQLQKGSKKTEEKKPADAAAKPKTDAKPLVDVDKSQTTDQAQPAQEEVSFPSLQVPPPKEIISGGKGEEEVAEMVEEESATVVKLPTEQQEPSPQQPEAPVQEEAESVEEDTDLFEELEQRMSNAVNKALEPVVAGINGLQDSIFVHTKMLTDCINSARTDIRLDLEDQITTQTELQSEMADARVGNLETRLNENAGKKGEEIVAKVEEILAPVNEQIGELQRKIDELIKALTGVDELLTETIKHGLVLILESGNYQEALVEFMKKFDKDRVAALLPVVAQDFEFVRGALVRKYYPAVSLEELDRDARRTEQRKWVDDTASIIVKRAQKCAEGDV